MMDEEAGKVGWHFPFFRTSIDSFLPFIQTEIYFVLQISVLAYTNIECAITSLFFLSGLFLLQFP